VALVEERNPAIPAPRELTTTPRRSDQVFRVVVFLGGLSSLIILAAIAIFLGLRGYEILVQEGWRFITGYEWYSSINSDGSSSDQPSVYGIGAMLIGTIITALIAVAIGVPISVTTALYLNFYAPNALRNFLVAVVDLMAAFPSILFGLWAFNVLMPSGEYWAKLLHKYFGFIPLFDVAVPAFSRSPFIAGIVLAIMIIPIVTSVAREVFSQTPLDRIQAAYALGATKWAMIKSVVLPFGYGGVVGGSMLGLGRAMGETVAVFTVLNIVFQANFQILLGAGGNIASLIILKFGEASAEEVKALMAAGLILFLLTLIVNIIADFIVNRTVKSGR
jgi:phosphate transport system permease protein